MGRSGNTRSLAVAAAAPFLFFILCQVLAFSRDTDDDPERRQAIEEGNGRIPVELSAWPFPEVIGGRP